jgi:sugar phosphate isomerase/epimerase
MNRRNFLTTASTTAAMLASPLASISETMKTPVAPGYQLIILATNWGFQGTHDEFCAKIKAAGYDGTELWWPSDENDRAKLFEALSKHSLKIGFLCGSGETDFQKHEAQFQNSIRNAAAAKPLYINCHSGKDFFSLEQNLKLIEFTNTISTQTGVPIYHETHRSRALFSTPVTKNFIAKSPQLKITLDISHWCNVHESLLADQKEIVDFTLLRTEHIHARIGHPEGPQVNDPRAPEWKDAVQAHLSWWDKVVERKKKEGGRITFLTEFGPPDYMPTLPYTRQPLADQWEINVYMMELLRKRYS